jgi:hypothetical protein
MSRQSRRQPRGTDAVEFPTNRLLDLIGKDRLKAVGAAVLAALAALFGLSQAPKPAPAPQGSQVPRVCVDVTINLPPGTAGLAAMRNQTWKPGQVLRVRFLEGGPRQKSLAFKYISAWSKVCNIKFRAVESGDAEIRVTFQPGLGSWSYIGTGSAAVPGGSATMNLGWLEEDSDESEFYVATHEAGHALGFVHGQNAPNSPIPWDVAKVYRYFSGPPNFWDRQTIYNNVIMRYSGTEALAGPWDRDSIMQYPVDQALTVGDFEVGWNTEISEGDAAFARHLYPFPGDPKPGDPSPVAPGRDHPFPRGLAPANCPAPAAFVVPRDRLGTL